MFQHHGEKKSKHTQQSAERKAQMTRDRKTMRHLNKDKEKLAEYSKLTPDKKKFAKERYKQFGSFDEVNVIKGDKTADRNTKKKGYRWRTAEQIKKAEGWSPQNKNKAALRNAENLIKSAKNGQRSHKVLFRLTSYIHSRNC